MLPPFHYPTHPAHANKIQDTSTLNSTGHPAAPLQQPTPQLPPAHLRTFSRLVHRAPFFCPSSPPAPDTEYAATLHTVLSALDSALVSAGLLGGMLGGYLLLVLLAVCLATSELRLPVVQYASSAPPPPDAAKQGGGMVRACGA